MNVFLVSNMEDPSWSDPYRTMDGSPWIKVGVTLAVIVILTSGSMLSLGVALYEKWGGDPHKRGLSNQVINGCQSQ